MYNPSMYLPQSPQMPQPFQLPPPYQQSANVDHTIKVSGRDSAYQYCQRMGPNSTSPAMFDTTRVGIMYIGTTDGAGMPTIEAFDYSPHVDEQDTPAIDPSQYVSRTEFDDVVRQIKEAINGIHGQAQAMQPATVPTNGPVAAGQADRRQ